MEFQKKRLALVLASLLATTMVSGCDWWDDDKDSTQQGVTLPPTEVVDQVTIVAPSEPTVAPGSIAFSYLTEADAAPTARALVAPVKFADWTLAVSDCDGNVIEEGLSPVSEDDFGPVWSVPVGDATCLDLTVLDGSGSPRDSVADLTLAEYPAGNVAKVQGRSELFTSRAAAGAVFTGIDTAAKVTLPQGDPPGEAVETAPAATAVLQFVDADGSLADVYDTMNLYIWNNGEGCGADAPGADIEALTGAAGANTGWPNAAINPAGSDEFGPYWEIPVTDDAACFQVIVRTSPDDAGKRTGDITVDLSENTDRIVAVANGASPGDAKATRAEAYSGGGFAGGVAGAAAHLIDDKTLIWDEAGAEVVDSVRLFYTKDVALAANAAGEMVPELALTLDPVELTDEQKAKFPHLASKKAFSLRSLPAGATLEVLSKGELIAVAADENGELKFATQVQMPGALDALFAADALDEQLGATVVDGGVQFKLWAPTAKAVWVKLYDNNKQATSALAMAYDQDSGVWSVTSNAAAHGTFYRYVVQQFYPQTREVKQLEVTDPYSLSLSMNSQHSQVVNLDDPSTKPAGWDDDYQTPEMDDFVVYESHIRDFSVADADSQYPGLYKAFTETQSAPMQHLQKLKDAGLTHFQLLPAFDLATINEDPAKRVDITDTVAKLCEVNVNAVACAADSGIARDAVIKDLLAAFDPASDDAQALMADIRGFDSFNWGYDPFHYGVPEGSYATNPDGITRIVEFREMVQALHTMGLGVAMDVVYNHTNESGLTDKSVLDKIVPWYYQRLNPSTATVENSTCCANTATEHAMMAKLMKDTLVVWTEQYKIDSFRFDLMGHQPLAAMEESLAATRDVNPNMYFYGEGWNFGEVQNDARFVQATQLNLAGTGIGSFSDRLRDAVRGGSPFDGADFLRKNQGFANGVYNDPNDQNSGEGVDMDALKLSAMSQADQIMVELTGNLADYVLVNKEGEVVTGKDIDYGGQPSGYTQSPKEVITYVSKHDNQTLWDINQYKLPADMTSAERAKAQVFALSFPAFGQGNAFIHMGSDLLRSKSMERDSYDSGDWYNLVDFTGQTTAWNVGLPRQDKDGSNWDLIKTIIANDNTKPTADDIDFATTAFQELLSIRAESKLFRLGTKEAVMARVDFHNVGPEQTPGVIVMSIDDGVDAGDDLDATKDAVVVVFNGSDEAYTKDLGVTGLVLHDNHAVSAEGAAVTGSTITVPGYTTAVFVLPQDGEQGAGIPVAEKVIGDQPTFGEVAVLLRGSVTTWDPGTATTYIGDGVYSIDVELAAGEYQFKFADSGWGTLGVNFGYNDVTVAEDSLPLTGNGDGNFVLSLAAGGTFTFSIDADEADQPVVKVTEVVPFGEAVVLLRGSVTSWDPGTATTYAGAGVYSVSVDLAAGDYQFKFADAGWGAGTGINFGFNEATVADGSLPLSGNGDGNFVVTIPTEGLYDFQLNAADVDALEVKVSAAAE